MRAEGKKYGIGMTVAACLWLGLFPLLQFFTYSSITHDKWVCMLILTGVTAVCFLVDLVCRRVSRPRLLSLICGGGLLLWILLSCIFSPYTNHESFFDSPWVFGAGRREGLITQLCYFGLFFLFSFSRVRRRPAVLAAGTGVIVFLVIVLLQRAGGNPLGLYPEGKNFANAPSFQGTIGHVDIGAGYLVVSTGILLPALIDGIQELVLIMKKKQKAVLWILYVIFLLTALAFCIFLILTVDADLGVLTLIVLVVWTFVRFVPKKLRLAVLASILASFLLLVWFWPGSGGPVWELHEILQGRAYHGYGNMRVGVWNYCLTMLQENGHLILGTGADTFALRFSSFLNGYYEAHPEAWRILIYFDAPHNDYIAWASNYGIPGVLIFLVLVIAGCFGRPAWRDGVLCYGIQVSLSFSVCILAPMFWVVLGMAYSMPKEKD